MHGKWYYGPCNLLYGPLYYIGQGTKDQVYYEFCCPRGTSCLFDYHLICQFQWITCQMVKNKPFLIGVGRGSLDCIYIRFVANVLDTWDHGCTSSLSLLILFSLALSGISHRLAISQLAVSLRYVYFVLLFRCLSYFYSMDSAGNVPGGCSAFWFKT